MRMLSILAADLVVVVLFAILGRASHAEALSPAGIAETAWPFLVAAVIGSLLAQRWGGGSWWRQGLIVWPITVVLGVALRLLGGRTAALGFVVVTTVVLALLLFGWRWLARARLSSAPEPV